MEYLTTHDLVWLSNVVTGTVAPYNYVTLESAMAAQYRYGDSRDVMVQAAAFLHHLLFKPPFAIATQGTAFIATLTFLNANGYATAIADIDAAATIAAVADRRLGAAEAVATLAAPAVEPLGNITLRQLITLECNTHEEALGLLTAASGLAAA